MDPSGCISDATKAQGAIYVPTMDRWIWLMEEFTITDLCYMYHCSPSELLFYEINDFPVFVEIDDPWASYEANPSAKWVEAEWFTSRERGIMESIIMDVIFDESWYEDDCYGREVDGTYPWIEFFGAPSGSSGVGVPEAYINETISAIVSFCMGTPLPSDSWGKYEKRDQSTRNIIEYWEPVLFSYEWIYYWAGKLTIPVAFGHELVDDYLSWHPGIQNPYCPVIQNSMMSANYYHTEIFLGRSRGGVRYR